LFVVCVRSVCCLHETADFDRDRLNGPAPLSSYLLDFSVHVTFPFYFKTGEPIHIDIYIVYE